MTTTTQNRVDTKKTILLILEDWENGATTAEIIEEAAQVSKECRDRVPRTLIALEREGKIKKEISKERKAIVWKLISA